MDVSCFKNVILEYTRKIEENTNHALNTVGLNYGLTNMQIRILMKLSQEGGLSIGNLAEGVRIAGTNLSSMCKRLEKEGYLTRYRDPKDERVVRIDLTNKGKSVVEDINHDFNQKLVSIMKDSNEQALEDIIFGIKSLNDLLEKIKKTN